MSNFHPLEVVGRGSETQLQVGENLNRFTRQDTGLMATVVTLGSDNQINNLSCVKELSNARVNDIL